jgi:hypothetical protein
LLVLLPLVVGLFIRVLCRSRQGLAAGASEGGQPGPGGRAGHGHRGELEHDRVDVRVVGDRHAIVIVIVAGVLGVLLGLLLGGRSAEVRTRTGLVPVFHFASLGLIIIGSQLLAIRRTSALPSLSR